MKAVVLCAGLGTRLRPLTEKWPKPAIPLLGKPLLRYAIDVLRRGGVDALGINTHHLPRVMEKVAREEAARAGVPLTISHEPIIQGTAGGIRGLRPFVGDETFVVWNGDILFDLDLGAVVHEHRQSGVAATMVLMPMPAGESYAPVEVDSAGKVVRIAGQGPGAAKVTPMHFTGVHVLSPTVFAFMASDGEEDINRSVYPRMLERGQVIRAAKTTAAWSDLGTPARYLSAQAGLLHARSLAEPDAAVDPKATLGPNVYVGARCRIGAGARLERAAVLEGTTIAPGEALLGAIAWDDKRLRVTP